MWKKVWQAAAFLALAALIFGSLSPVFVPKDNGPGSGIHEFEAKGFLAEPENSLDVLFLGDSESFSAFIPLQIWEDHGIPSYLCCTANQVMYQSLAYLERVLQTQSPRTVILETNALYREYTLSDAVSYEVQEYFPLLRYHDRWKTLGPEDFGSPVDFRTVQRDKGYVYRTRAIEADLTGYMAPSEEMQPVPELNRWYLQKIRERCQAAGAELILVSTPSPVNWSMYYHNGVTALAEEMGLTYLDLNLMKEQVPIDWTTDSYDGGDHMNYAGAAKVTAFVGDYLQETGLFSDKRGDPDYSAWNGCLQAFREHQKDSTEMGGQ